MSSFSFLQPIQPSVSGAQMASDPRAIFSLQVGDGRNEKVTADALLECDKCPHLRVLLASNSTLASLNGVAVLRHLWYLDVSWSRVESLAGLETVKALGHLDVRGTDVTYTNLTFSCVKMHILNLRMWGSKAAQQAPRKRFVAALPRVLCIDDVFVTVAETELACKLFAGERRTAHRNIAGAADADVHVFAAQKSHMADVVSALIQERRTSLSDGGQTVHQAPVHTTPVTYTAERRTSVGSLMQAQLPEGINTSAVKTPSLTAAVTTQPQVTSPAHVPVRRPRKSLLQSKGEWDRLDSVALGPECADLIDTAGAEPTDMRLRDTYRLKYIITCYLRDAKSLRRAYSKAVDEKGVVLRKPSEVEGAAFPPMHLYLLESLPEEMLASIVSILACVASFPNLSDALESPSSGGIAGVSGRTIVHSVPTHIVQQALLQLFIEHVVPSTQSSSEPTPFLAAHQSMHSSPASKLPSCNRLPSLKSFHSPAPAADEFAVLSQEVKEAETASAVILPEHFEVLNQLSSDLSSLPIFAMQGWVFLAYHVARARGFSMFDGHDKDVEGVLMDERPFVRKMLRLEDKDGSFQRISIDALRAHYFSRNDKQGASPHLPSLSSSVSFHYGGLLRNASSKALLHAVSSNALRRNLSGVISKDSHVWAAPNFATDNPVKSNDKWQRQMWSAIPLSGVIEQCGAFPRCITPPVFQALFKPGVLKLCAAPDAATDFISVLTVGRLLRYFSGIRSATTLYRLQGADDVSLDVVADVFRDMMVDTNRNFRDRLTQMDLLRVLRFRHMVLACVQPSSDAVSEPAVSTIAEDLNAPDSDSDTEESVHSVRDTNVFYEDDNFDVDVKAIKKSIAKPTTTHTAAERVSSPPKDRKREHTHRPIETDARPPTPPGFNARIGVVSKSLSSPLPPKLRDHIVHSHGVVANLRREKKQLDSAYDEVLRGKLIEHAHKAFKVAAQRHHEIAVRTQHSSSIDGQQRSKMKEHGLSSSVSQTKLQAPQKSPLPVQSVRSPFQSAPRRVHAKQGVPTNSRTTPTTKRMMNVPIPSPLKAEFTDPTFIRRLLADDSDLENDTPPSKTPIHALPPSRMATESPETEDLATDDELHEASEVVKVLVHSVGRNSKRETLSGYGSPSSSIGSADSAF